MASEGQGGGTQRGHRQSDFKKLMVSGFDCNPEQQ
jgi:hypothetical protein